MESTSRKYIAHRGLNLGPENCLEAIVNAWKKKIFGIEIDLRVKNGVLYLSHDVGLPKEVFNFSLVDKLKELTFFVHLKQPLSDYRIQWPRRKNLYYFKDDEPFEKNYLLVPNLIPFGIPKKAKYSGLIWADTKVLPIEIADESTYSKRVIWIDEVLLGKPYFDFFKHSSCFALCTHL